MKPILRVLLALTLFMNALSAQTEAKLRLPSVLSDHMVIQRDKPVRLWGWAKPGEVIAIQLGSMNAEATTGDDGRWQAEIPPIEVAEKALTLTVQDSVDTLTVSDILVGEVWLCSGQSNMAWSVGQTLNANEALPEADRPTMRYFKVKGVHAPELQDDAPGEWVVCTPQTAKGFSAVGYFFGRDIQAALNTPVGLIDASQGSSAAQVFVSYDALRADPALASYLKDYAALLDDPAAATAVHEQWMKDGGAQYYKDRQQWYMDAYAAGQKNEKFDRPRPTPPSPEPPFFNDTTKFPTVIYNARIYPLHPLMIRGALWYQGESNSNDPLYDKLLAALIANWRAGWGIGDFPFLIVQLPNRSQQQASPELPNLGWTRIRELQMEAHQSTPNTAIVCTIDVGSTENPVENFNLHPQEKENIGERLALAALRLAYGEDLIASGPVFESATVDGEQIRVAFTEVGQGLKIGAPPKTSLTPPPPTDALRGFAIAGADKQFVAAQAKIDGANEVVLWSDAVSEPAYVRYAWQYSPIANLYNSADLPAFPFRTDAD